MTDPTPSQPIPAQYLTDAGAIALCLWREARGEHYRGMTAVACVIKNRTIRHKCSYLWTVFTPWAFSSMTAPHDPQRTLYPPQGDPQWNEAQDIAKDLMLGNVADITEGATLYYDDSIGFPYSWDRSKVVPTVEIGRFKFWREL